MTTTDSRLAGHESFSLDDADGNAHAYDIEPHAADEGQGIVFRIMALGAEPLGSIIQAVATAGEIRDMIADKMEEGGIDAVLEIDYLSVLATVDFTRLGKAVKEVLATGEAPDLVRAVLKHTRRDDIPLDKDGNFGRAFQANYGEMLAAAYYSIKVNRFFVPLDILTTAGDEKLKALGDKTQASDAN